MYIIFYLDMFLFLTIIKNLTVHSLLCVPGALMGVVIIIIIIQYAS